jgi:hypothetical protein
MVVFFLVIIIMFLLLKCKKHIFKKIFNQKI